MGADPMSGWIFLREGPVRYEEDEAPDCAQFPLHTYAYHEGIWWNPEPGWIVVAFPPSDGNTFATSIRDKGWYFTSESSVPAHLKAWMLIL